MPNLSRTCNSNRFLSGNSRRVVAWFLLVLFTSGLTVYLPVSGRASETTAQEVFVIPIHETIDLGLAFFVKRSLGAAKNAGANQIVLDINTFGGRVDAAVDIRDALDECEIPTAAYVNKRAISAGALISLATKEIAMAPGSTIGAATPISMGPGGEKLQLGEKEVSYVRGEFRATAERNGHSPVLAEAMVDADTEAIALFGDEKPRILLAADAEKLEDSEAQTEREVISPKGKLLTLTAEEAVRVGLAGSMPETLDEFIRSLGLDPLDKTVTRISWSEYIVRFLTNPIVAGLLLTLGVLGIFFELQMPGWGISGTIGVVLLLLFFGGHYLAGLANVTDVLLFLIGLALLAMEFFVVPGFGITGIAGFICILVGIYLALVTRPVPRFSWDYQSFNSAFITVVVALIAIPVGSILIWRMFPDSRLRKSMVLSASERGEDGYTASDTLERLVGCSGKSLTHLRPAGRALIEDEPMEVQTAGEFVEKDRNLKVIKVVGNKVFVAEVQQGKDEIKS